MGLTKKLGKLGSAAALVGSLATGSGVVAQEESQEVDEGLSARINTEFTLDFNEFYKMQNIVGVGPKGIYDGQRINSKSQFFEHARFRDFVISDDGKTTHYTLGGVRLYDLDLGGIPSDAVIFGSVGDIQGAGIETAHQFGDLTLTFNADARFGDDDATHLGTELDWRVNDNLFVGIGFDNVDTNQGDLEQYFATGEVRLSDNDSVGLTFATVDRPDGSRDNSLAGMYLHYGKDEDWGLRALVRYDWGSEGGFNVDANQDTDFSRLSGQLIFAERPTTYEPGATWFLGRNIRDDESFHQSTIPLALSTDGVRLPDRAGKGFAFTLEGFLTDSAGVESGHIGAGAAYMFSKDYGRDEIGVSLLGGYDFGDLTGDSYNISPGVIYRNGNFTLDAGLDIPISGDRDEVVGRIGFGIKF